MHGPPLAGAVHAAAAGGAAAAGLVILAAAAARWQRGWQLRRTPPSRIRSAAAGAVVLQGCATPVGPARTAPLSGTPAVWYRTSRAGRLWGGPALGEDYTPPFQLEDPTGRVLVVPAGARVLVPPVARSFEDGSRVLEWSLPAGEEVLVAGELKPPEGGAERRRARVTALLQGWLRDPVRRAELDTNKDGIIEDDEWDAARGKAQEAELREEGAAGSVPPSPPVVVKPALGTLVLCPAARLPGPAAGPLLLASAAAGAVLAFLGATELAATPPAELARAAGGVVAGVALVWGLLQGVGTLRLAVHNASELELAFVTTTASAALVMMWLGFLSGL